MGDSRPERKAALIQGASRGIGLALTERLCADGWRVLATSRAASSAPALRECAQRCPNLTLLELDVTDEESIIAAAARAADLSFHPDLLMNVAGLLHAEGVQPEKKLDHVRPDALAQLFAVNATGPLLVAKHFAPLLPRDRPAVVANLSARVGSIGDDRLGGWYGYRASKAAQNMFTRNLAIELGRRYPHLAVVALHPGTVATDLSAPFTRRREPSSLHSPDAAAGHLLDVVRGLTAEDTGRFFAWDGKEIPW